MLVYDTLEQARLRLRHTVLTYLGSAVMVREIREATRTKPMLVDVSLYPLNNDKGLEIETKKLSISINDPDLNFRLFRVGYINDPLNKKAQFFTRTTARQQSQGLVPSSLFGGTNRMPNWLSGTQSFEDMLMNKYPDPATAFSLINTEGWESVAISQSLAVGRDAKLKSLFKLFYRGAPVGLAVGKNFESFILEEEFSYLKEVLGEENIPFTLEAA